MLKNNKLDIKMNKRWTNKVKKAENEYKKWVSMNEDSYTYFLDYESAPSFFNSQWGIMSGTTTLAKLPLGETETICPHCSGIGLQSNFNTTNPNYISECKSCHGTGKLDWASRLTAGVKE